jgi:hypothetical protein
MNKILLDGKEVETLVPESLPMLIHGEHGSGGSLYTVCLAAKWFTQGYDILFLCGYPMAEEAFSKEVGNVHPNARFFIQEKAEEFMKAVKTLQKENTAVVVKNIELFDDKVFNAVHDLHNLIISGDVYKSKAKENILAKEYTTEIYFSAVEGKDIPELQKYQGFVMTEGYKGMTSLFETSDVGITTQYKNDWVSYETDKTLIHVTKKENWEQIQKTGYIQPRDPSPQHWGGMNAIFFYDEDKALAPEFIEKIKKHSKESGEELVRLYIKTHNKLYKSVTKERPLHIMTLGPISLQEIIKSEVI